MKTFGGNHGHNVFPKTMAEKWKTFKKKMEEKRDINKKNKEKPTKKISVALKSGELTVQRLSTFVFGKAQTYSRVGPREFVPHQKEDITFESIKQSCKNHFAPKMDPDQVIDILAGEQGPSCRSLTQIPDLKLIHIRFVSKTLIESDDEDETFDFPVVLPAKKKKLNTTVPKNDFIVPASVPKVLEASVKASKGKKTYPKSISILDMMKLGKEVEIQLP